MSDYDIQITLITGVRIKAESGEQALKIAENTLKRLDEPIYMPNYLAKRGWSK